MTENTQLDLVIYPMCFVFSLYLGNPMDPPDILGLDSNAAKPTKLPNRAKSKQWLNLVELGCSALLQIHHFFISLCLLLFLIISSSTFVSEQPPPRPPKPAVLLKSKNHFSSSKNH